MLCDDICYDMWCIHGYLIICVMIYDRISVMICIILCDNVYWCILCYVTIYDDIPGNISHVLTNSITKRVH